MEHYKQTKKDFTNPYEEHYKDIKLAIEVAYKVLKDGIQGYMKSGMKPVTYSLELKKLFEDKNLRGFLNRLDNITKIVIEDDDGNQEECEVGLIETDKLIANIILNLDFLLLVFEFTEEQIEKYNKKHAKLSKTTTKKGSRPKKNPQTIHEVDKKMFEESPSKKIN